MYDVRLSRKAQDFYKKADRSMAKKLARCFEQLERDPRNHSNVKPLKGTMAGHFRYRVGDYRVIYRVDDANNEGFVLTNAHRSEAYE